MSVCPIAIHTRARWEHLGEPEATAGVLRAIETVLAQPKHRTRNLGATASTVACGQAIIDAL